jgi:hypothetical protein
VAGLARLEMGRLIERVHGLLAEHERRVVVEERGTIPAAELARRSGLRPRGSGPPELGVGRPLGLELGHPATLSLALVLPTARTGLVRDRRISRIGPDLEELSRARGPHPFAQLVLLELDDAESRDGLELESAALLVHRLSGYAPRLLPGRVWVRVAREALDAGLDAARLGEALCAVYRLELGVRGVEVVFLLGDRALCEALTPLRGEAELRFGRHRKLSLAEAGGSLEAECLDLDCEHCEERVTCDSLRDVRIRRRRGAR